MNEFFTIISCAEDGDHYIEILSEEMLRNRLKSEFWGSNIQIHTVHERESLNLGYLHGVFIIPGRPINKLN